MVKEKKKKIKSISKSGERKGKQFTLDRKAVKKDKFIEGAAAQIGKGSIQKANEKELEANAARQKPTQEQAAVEQQNTEVPQEVLKRFEDFEEGKRPNPLIGDIGGFKIDLTQSIGTVGGREVTGAETAAVAATLGTLGAGGAIIKTAQTAHKAASISRIAAVTGLNAAKVTKVVNAAGTPTKIVGGLTAANLASKGFRGASAVAGADVLVTWYALDNVITGQKFFMRDIVAGVSNGTIPPEEAMKALRKSQETRATAIDLVNKSSELNPLLWPFRDLIMTGVAADEDSIALLEDQITQLAAGKITEQQDAQKSDAIKRLKGITPAGG